MSTVGWIGLGKLGLTSALALAHESYPSHTVVGYDISPLPGKILDGDIEPHKEEGLAELVGANQAEARVVVRSSVEEVIQGVDHNGVVFVSAQTPHSPQFGGETSPPPYETRDFEYGYLINAVREIAAVAQAQKKYITLVVISTVLPGTTHKHLAPLLNGYTSLVYNPFFIAMGTTVQDFTNPEFVLLGSDNEQAMLRVQELYETVHNRPVRQMSVESAELTKVAYNTFISMKIVFANTLMEICQKTGADVDEVTQALAKADQRIASGAYMHGGMGDGGGCHPRDNIAMADLARRLDLHADPFTFVTDSRTTQSYWLAEEVKSWWELTKLPVTILGVAYKPESNLTLGSSALLLLDQLVSMRVIPAFYDPHVDQVPTGFQGRRLSHLPMEKQIFVIGAKHDSHLDLKLPKGSVVLDPFGYMPALSGITTIRLGRKY